MALGRETEPTRPSILATLLWAFGIFIIGLTIYIIISLHGWTENPRDILLIFVAFLSGVNAIATGALIDMHSMRYRTERKVRE